jgi:hypothetical protein
MDSQVSLKLKQLREQMDQQKKARTKRPQSASKMIVAGSTEIVSTSALLGLLDDPKPRAATSEVLDFLREIGLEKHWEAFRDAQIDEVEVLAELSEEHLASLGLPIGHRIKLLKRIRETRGPANPPSPPKLKQSRQEERKVRFEVAENPQLPVQRPKLGEGLQKAGMEDMTQMLTVQPLKPKPSSERVARVKVEDPKTQMAAPRSSRAVPQPPVEPAKKKPPITKPVIAKAQPSQAVAKTESRSQVSAVKLQTPTANLEEVKAVRPVSSKGPSNVSVQSSKSSTDAAPKRPSTEPERPLTEPEMPPTEPAQEKPSTWLLFEKPLAAEICYECTAFTAEPVVSDDRTYCSEACVEAAKQGRLLKCSCCSRDFLSSCGVVKGSSWYCSQECSHRKSDVGSNTEIQTPSSARKSSSTVESAIGTEDDYVVTSLRPSKQRPSEARLVFNDPDPVIAPRRPSEARLKKFMASTEKVEGW